jgi:hypothetical protein
MQAPLSSGLWPDLAHTAEDHLAVRNVHLVRADCSVRQWVSRPDDLFRSSF